LEAIEANDIEKVKQINKKGDNMKFDVNYNKKHNCLIASFEGDLNPSNAKEYIKTIAIKAKKHNCKCLLNDLRKANIDFSIAELYELPEIVITKEFDRTWARAIVTKVNSEKLNFFETTAYNQGLTVKFFNNINKALKWLKT